MLDRLELRFRDAAGVSPGVLETALAERADVLVTANWRDFLFKDVEEITPGRVARFRELILLHTAEAAGVLSGRRQLPPGIRGGEARMDLG